MTKPFSYVLFTLVLMAVWSCHGQPECNVADHFWIELGDQKRISAADYLDIAIDSIEYYAYYSDSVNWDSVRDEACQELDHVRSANDAHQLIERVLNGFGDGHSYFLSSNQMKTMLNSPERSGASSISAYTVDGVGYIKLPGFYAPGKPGLEYALRGRDLIDSLLSMNITGIIIDLRSSSGGSMMPDIAALRRIWSNDTLFFCAYSKRFGLVPIRLIDGDYYQGDELVLDMPNAFSPRITPSFPVAYLISESTASAGEAVAVALDGESNAYGIGKETRGFTTGISGITLPDSSVIALSTSRYADRKGRLYRGRLTPDLFASTSRLFGQDSCIEMALKHIKSFSVN